MGKKILITGGAGFIGSHLADELLAKGYQVRVLDNLSEQVHGRGNTPPDYLHPEVDLQIGDINDQNAVENALKGMDAVFHFAAKVGVGQSMYEIKEYTNVNNIGTAVLLEAIIRQPVEKLIVASSMSIYGEGLYSNTDGTVFHGTERKLSQLREGKWELYGEGGKLIPVRTNENKMPSLSSIYALSKYDQERMCLMTGKAYGIPTSALRFFNVYGPRQSLSNPYTGVLAIFASHYLNNKSPLIFEDGYQQRDFVNVLDVAKACRLALETPESAGEVFNIGSGKKYTIQEIAAGIAQNLGKEYLKPEITGKYRTGDIRHCFADISKAKRILGYAPEISFENGLNNLTLWLKKQASPVNNYEQAKTELFERGLTV